MRLLLLLWFVAKDVRSGKEVAALGKTALRMTLGTWGYGREPAPSNLTTDFSLIHTIYLNVSKSYPKETLFYF